MYITKFHAENAFSAVLNYSIAIANTMFFKTKVCSVISRSISLYKYLSECPHLVYSVEKDTLLSFRAMRNIFT